MMPRAIQLRREDGFTLVEAIIAIVLLGIVSSMVAVFIRAPLQGYRDSRVRAELTDLADLALRRMARDLRLALPNSVRTSGTTIELLLTKTGGRYLTVDDASPSGTPLSFDDSAQRTFTVVGPLAGGRAAIVPGSDYLVINNQGTEASVAPANAYLLTGAQRNIAAITGVSEATPNLPTITLSDNPFAVQSPSMPSESARFQIVSGPVTYHCVPGASGNGTLYRHANYPITAAQGVPPAGGQSSPLISGVKSCIFDYKVDAGGRGGLVTLKLELQVPGDDAMIKLVHQIHVDNTP